MRCENIFLTVEAAREARAAHVRAWLRGLFHRPPRGLRIRIEWAR